MASTNLKKILMIATGGTIASQMSDTGLVPQMNPSHILAYVPEIAQICQVTTNQIYNIDSTNMNKNHWISLAKLIEYEYDNYDGFVILHGTDTMSYTAAALSYLIQDSRKPIVLTGSQQPIDRNITDGKANLLNSFYFAIGKHSHGVVVIFHGKVIAGTRARKIKTKSDDAFASINYPNLALIQDKTIIRYIYSECCIPKPTFSHGLNDRIFLLKLTPGMDASIIYYLKDYYDGLVIESFGVGGLPEYEDGAFARAIESWVNDNKVVVIHSQVHYEGSDMKIYQTGLGLKKRFKLIESYGMTLEATITKLMWILSQTKDIEEIRTLFYTPINFDMLDLEDLSVED